MEIRVGIKTCGSPLIREEGGYTVVQNMLIGDGFHWEKNITVRLAGKVELIKREQGEYPEISGNKITLINTLPLETYLESVVGSEMNPAAPIEFLKAHAVISRSWALGKILRIHPESRGSQTNGKDRLIGWDDTGTHQGFHVCSDDHCQRYQGIQEIDRKALQAIRATADEVLVSGRGNIIDARFSKCCGGTTEVFSTCWQPVEMDCLISMDDPWCDLTRLSAASRRILLSGVLKDYDLSTPGYGFRWEMEISKTEIEKNLKEKFGRNIGRIIRISPLHRGKSGRIDLIRIEGSEARLELGKELWIRRLLAPSHLFSSAFHIEESGDVLRLKGRGWGHGVGLCQIGAANMALNGAKYPEILAFYYPGSKITRIGEIKTQ